MTELDVVNDALATMGISPLNQLDDNNPDVANIRRITAAQSEELQAQGWWFNVEAIDLFPDATSGFIYTPNDAIVVDPIPSRAYVFNRGGRLPFDVNHVNPLPVVQRGSRMYDTDRNTFDFTGFGGMVCRLVRKIPFNDLPPSAQRVIGLATVRKFQQSFDADPQKMGRLDQEYVVNLAMLKAEHTRNIRPNLMNKSTTINALNRISGSSYRWR